MAYRPASSQNMGSSNEVPGQRHDRFESHNLLRLGEPDEMDDAVSISIGQKMLSAVSGSLITSLLVTPLDVVRVRMQSQQIGYPSHSTLGQSAISFTNLPRDLGISSCCREVFWVTNNTQYCVATPGTTTASVSSSSSSSSSSSLSSAAAAAARKIPSSATAASCAAEEAQRKTFTSTLDGLRKIVQNEGARTLWRGLSPTLAMAVPANVIYFAGYDWLRYNRQSPFRRAEMPDAYVPLAAGSTARVLAAIVVSPIEMVRTRMQAAHAGSATGSSGNVSETLRGLREMVSVRGYHSLWTGLGLTLWRDVPFSAIYWWGYEYGRKVLRDARERSGAQKGTSWSHENHTATLVDSFIAGAASGAVAALITTPFDVGKTRQQVVRHAQDVGATVASNGGKAMLPEELSMPRFLWHIYKSQGTSGLFKGWAARCLKVAPACAIMISSYEIGKKMAGGMNERRGKNIV